MSSSSSSHHHHHQREPSSSSSTTNPMQSLVDSLCRCFGSTPINHHDLMDQLDSLSLQQQQDHEELTMLGAGGARNQQRSSSYSSSLRDPFRVRKQVTPPTPEMKKRTRSLQLQDKQWDALFSSSATASGAAAVAAVAAHPSSSAPQVPQDPETPKSSNHRARAAASASRGHSPRRAGPFADDDDDAIASAAVEQARAVAEAKQMAAAAPPNGASPPTNSKLIGRAGGNGKKKSLHKRKRSSSGTRDDIFRTKRNSSSCSGGGSHHHHPDGAQSGTRRRYGAFGLGGGDGLQHPLAAYCGDIGVGSARSKSPNHHPSTNATVNRISRFLSNHPVFASSLCFATPVTDSAEEGEYDDDGDADNDDSHDLVGSDMAGNGNADEMTSVVSGDNTLNTAEDTITSTLYYETTTLAGLKQTSPPMPLFNSFCVDERDDIHRIISTHSHMTSNRPHHHQYQSALPQPVRRPLSSNANSGGSPAASAANRARQSPSPKGTPTRPPTALAAPPTLRLSPKRPTGAAADEVMAFSRPAGLNHGGHPRSAPLRFADSSSPPPPVQTPPQTPTPPATAAALHHAGPAAHGRLQPKSRLDDGIPATVSSSDSSRSQGRL